MARNRRWMVGARAADSKWEGKLRDTIFKDWTHQAEKIPYTVPHNYTPDFELKDILIESKGRFREPAEASKYIHVRDALVDKELVFVFYNPYTPMPFAKKRKDGTKQTHAEWAEKHKFRWYTEESVSDLFEEMDIEYPTKLIDEMAEKLKASKKKK